VHYCPGVANDLSVADDPVDDTGLPDDEGLPRDRPKGVFGKIVSGALSYGVVVAVFWFLFNKLSSADSMGSSLALISPLDLAVMTVLGVVNLATNLPPIVITLPGLRLREAAVTNTASAALSNTVPEGGAVATGLNFAMLRSWGFRLDAITSSFLTTGIWTNLVRYGLLAAAIVVLALTEATPTLLWLSIAVVVVVVLGIVLLFLVLRSERFAARLGRFAGRVSAPVFKLFRRPAIDHLDDQVVAFRTDLVATLRRVWHALTAAMLVSQLTTCLVLGVAVRMEGFDNATTSWSRIIVAYGAASLASLIAPTPGGMGVAEASLLAVLGVGLTDEQMPAMVAAVLLYRYATWFVPIPIGAGTYLFWRKTPRWRMTQAERESHPVRVMRPLPAKA
jgi:putative heme transporter